MLLPVVVRPRAAATEMTTWIELHIGDVIIRATGDTDVAYIAKLVDALRG
jgi:hypothetical protein